MDFNGVQLPQFVLVLEKFAIYQRLVEERFCATRDCLLVTGRGQPDRATRALLAKLDQWNVPCFLLVDGDPCGLDIYLTYRLGSWQLVHEQDIVVRGLILAGIRPNQIKNRFNFPGDVRLSLNQSDKSRISTMRSKILATMGIQNIEEFNNETMKQYWDIVMFYHELAVIEELEYKVELEALESIENGVYRGTYLSNFFIPEYVESRVIDHQQRVPIASLSQQQNEVVIEELPDDNYDLRLNDSAVGSNYSETQSLPERNPSQLSHYSGYYSQYSDSYHSPHHFK